MLPDARLIVVTGKGGVGKTVVAAAIGRSLAENGRRVLILEADPRENLHHLFGVDPSGGKIVDAAPRLAIRNADPRALLDRFVAGKLRFAALSRRVLASPIYQHFADGAPGLREMTLLGYALDAATGEADHDCDTVVIDAPASGHGLALLAAPLLVSDVIATGPLGHLAQRIAGVVTNPAECAIVIVTLAEEMPVQETLETAAAMTARLGRPPSLVVANAVWPQTTTAVVPGVEEALTLWATRRALNERELKRLAAGWRGPSVTVPLLGADFGPELMEGVCAALAG